MQQLQQQQMRQQQRPPPQLVAGHMLGRIRRILEDDTTNVLKRARMVHDDGLAAIWGMGVWVGVCVWVVSVCVLCVVCV